jgi:hypothetical protein
MSIEERGPDSILDQVISAIRSETPDPAHVNKAGERVWARIEQEAAGVDVGPEVIRTCADFQALIPAWREKRLSAARAALVEDHLHECPVCRNAAAGEKVVAMRPRRAIAAPVWRWAVAAAVVAGVGLTAWMMSDFAVPGGTGPRATVYAMDKSLYRVANGKQTLLASGTEINEGERVRTTKDAGAVLRLRDGSLVEMAARTELSVSQRRPGVTIHLDRGSVIVQAAKQRSRHLFVATDDCTVSVKGTIFSVNHGLKGSRVTVVEGEVHVDRGNDVKVLHAGDQVATSDTVGPVSIEDELAWSRDFEKYVALTREFAAVRRKLEAIPGAGLRYSSRLLDLVPSDTQFYAAIPNIGPTVAEASRLFEEQMAQSDVLKQWWAERVNSPEDASKLKDAINRIRVFSAYLGPELVLAMSRNADGNAESPLILAEVLGSGFRQYLDQEVAKINAEAKHGGLRVVGDPFQSAPASAEEMLVWTGNGIVAVAKDLALLQQVARPAAGAFRGTALGARVVEAYRDGVSWLICADLASLMAKERQDTHFAQSGFGALRFLVVQRKEISGQTENRAELSFAEPRQGVASWLAPPAPIRGLDFVSPDATFAAAFAVKEPRFALDDIVRMGGGVDFAEFEAKTGLSVRSDLVDPLGGEIVVALDGPMLPVPAWKVIAEVKDPDRIASAIERLVEAVNREVTGSTSQVRMTKETVGGRTFWAVANPGKLFEAHFTFENGFLIAAPTRDLVVRALQYRTTGYSLPKSQGFLALLPRDGNTNFSGMTYHAVGSTLAPFASRTLTPEQQKALKAVAGDTPTLILVYGEPDRIEIASRGTFFGLQPEQLMGLPSFGGGKTRSNGANRRKHGGA